MADVLELSQEQQSLLDQMRADDAAPPDAAPAAPPIPQPAPAPPPAEPAVAPSPAQAPDRPDRYVPQEALHAEREEHKKTRDRLAETEQHIRTLEERTNILLQRFGQPPAAAPSAQPQPEAVKPPPIPDLDKDPVGHIIGRQIDFDRRLQESAQSWQQQQAQLTQQQQAQQMLTQLVQGAQAMEGQFAAEHPDYGQAINHLKLARHRELEQVGFRNPMEREQIIQQEGLGVAARMMQVGGNPAAALYELARMRGYAPPAANGAAAPAEVAPAAAPAQSATAQPAQTPQERLTTLAQGQEHARSLGGARGSSPAPMTAQRLLELSDTEFDKIMQTDEGRAILGFGG